MYILGYKINMINFIFYVYTQICKLNKSFLSSTFDYTSSPPTAKYEENKVKFAR